MMRVNGKFVVAPTLADLFDSLAEDIGSKLRVASVGEVLTYDPAKRTASIKVAEVLKLQDGTVVPIPAPLLDVPVLTIQGGGVHLGVPIGPGDECVVLFNDFNIDEWFTSGGQQVPGDRRQHDLADGFAVVGPNSMANALATLLSATEGGIATALAKVAIDKLTNKVTIQSNGQSLATVLANLLTPLQAAMAALGTDPGLQSSTKTAAVTAATAVTTAITALGVMLQ